MYRLTFLIGFALLVFDSGSVAAEPIEGSMRFQYNTLKADHWPPPSKKPALARWSKRLQKTLRKKFKELTARSERSARETMARECSSQVRETDPSRPRFDQLGCSRFSSSGGGNRLQTGSEPHFGFKGKSRGNSTRRSRGGSGRMSTYSKAELRAAGAVALGVREAKLTRAMKKAISELSTKIAADRRQCAPLIKARERALARCKTRSIRDDVPYSGWRLDPLLSLVADVDVLLDAAAQRLTSACHGRSRCERKLGQVVGFSYRDEWVDISRTGNLWHDPRGLLAKFAKTLPPPLLDYLRLPPIPRLAWGAGHEPYVLPDQVHVPRQKLAALEARMALSQKLRTGSLEAPESARNSLLVTRVDEEVQQLLSALFSNVDVHGDSLERAYRAAQEAASKSPMLASERVRISYWLDRNRSDGTEKGPRPIPDIATALELARELLGIVPPRAQGGVKARHLPTVMVSDAAVALWSMGPSPEHVPIPIMGLSRSSPRDTRSFERAFDAHVRCPRVKRKRTTRDNPNGFGDPSSFEPPPRRAYNLIVDRKASFGNLGRVIYAMGQRCYSDPHLVSQDQRSFALHLPMIGAPQATSSRARRKVRKIAMKVWVGSSELTATGRTLEMNRGNSFELENAFSSSGSGGLGLRGTGFGGTGFGAIGGRIAGANAELIRELCTLTGDKTPVCQQVLAQTRKPTLQSPWACFRRGSQGDFINPSAPFTEQVQSLSSLADRFCSLGLGLGQVSLSARDDVPYGRWGPAIFAARGKCNAPVTITVPETGPPGSTQTCSARIDPFRLPRTWTTRSDRR